MSAAVCYGRSSSGSAGQSPGEEPKKKRVLIESACKACQRRKSKCDGQRPDCTHCLRVGTSCHYAVLEGETRTAALKRRNTELADRARRQADLLNEQGDAMMEIVSVVRHDPNAAVSLRYASINNPNDPREVLSHMLRAQSMQPSDGSHNTGYLSQRVATGRQIARSLPGVHTLTGGPAPPDMTHSSLAHGRPSNAAYGVEDVTANHFTAPQPATRATSGSYNIGAVQSPYDSRSNNVVTSNVRYKY